MKNMYELKTSFVENKQEWYILLYFIKKTPWSESANELYRPSDSRLSAKRLPTFADRGCHVVSVTDPYDVFSVL
jgi:hypothetical protein